MSLRIWTAPLRLVSGNKYDRTNRDGFRQRQQKDRGECIVRVRPDKVD